MSIVVEKKGPVWTVIHNRPEARNAMDPESADALTQAFLEFDADNGARVAVLYGEGGAFCAGWDLKFVSTLNKDYPLAELDIPLAGPRGNGGEYLFAMGLQPASGTHGGRGACGGCIWRGCGLCLLPRRDRIRGTIWEKSLSSMTRGLLRGGRKSFLGRRRPKRGEGRSAANQN